MPGVKVFEARLAAFLIESQGPRVRNRWQILDVKLGDGAGPGGRVDQDSKNRPVAQADYAGAATPSADRRVTGMLLINSRVCSTAISLVSCPQRGGDAPCEPNQPG